MQITKPKAIIQKVLPLFLSLAVLAGLLPVSAPGNLADKRGRGSRLRSQWPQGRRGGGRPQGQRPRLVPGAMPWPPPHGIMCTPARPR